MTKLPAAVQRARRFVAGMPLCGVPTCEPVAVYRRDTKSSSLRVSGHSQAETGAGRTFGRDDVKLDDMEVAEGAHDVAVRVGVRLGAVRGRERARREERVARRAEVRDGGRAGVVRWRVRDLAGLSSGRRPRGRQRTSMYASTTRTLASSCGVRLAGKCSMALATPKRSFVCSAVSFTMAMGGVRAGFKGTQARQYI